MTDPNEEFPPMPADAAKFLADTLWVIRMQLAHPGRSLRSLNLSATFWPEGRTGAHESYPKPKAVRS